LCHEDSCLNSFALLKKSPIAKSKYSARGLLAFWFFFAVGGDEFANLIKTQSDDLFFASGIRSIIKGFVIF